jgi:hypothetical protein
MHGLARKYKTIDFSTVSHLPFPFAFHRLSSTPTDPIANELDTLTKGKRMHLAT